MTAEREFETAKALLKEHFGDETKITAAYMDNVHNWPVVKAENVSSLQNYALFLCGCNNAMADLQDMRELDMSANLKLVLSKLPFKLRDRFRLVAGDIRENQHRKPCFNDVVHFIECQVRLLSDPVFGDIQTAEKQMYIKRDESMVKPKVRRENFATNVCAVNKQRNETKETNHSNISCLFCLLRHSVNDCPKFTKIKHREKLIFLKEKGACFGCLNKKDKKYAC